MARRGVVGGAVTVGMPYFPKKSHRWWVEGVIFWKLQLGGEYAAFEGGAVGALDESFPEEDVVFGDGTSGDAVGGVGCEVFVFEEETSGGC